MAGVAMEDFDMEEFEPAGASAPSQCIVSSLPVLFTFEQRKVNFHFLIKDQGFRLKLALKLLSDMFPPGFTVEALSNASHMFDDTVEDFKSFPAVLRRYVLWRRDCSQSYSDAYIAHCFPKLVAPLVRFQLLGWNPMKVGPYLHFFFRDPVDPVDPMGLVDLLTSFLDFFTAP